MLRLFANPRVLAAFQFVGYALFFCLIATIAVPFTFPTRQLRAFVARQARAQGYPIEIDDLKVHVRGLIRLNQPVAVQQGLRAVRIGATVDDLLLGSRD